MGGHRGNPDTLRAVGRGDDAQWGNSASTGGPDNQRRQRSEAREHEGSKRSPARAIALGAVHVEQHRGAPAHVLKYFASGWCTTIASVDCSGCSWNSSDSSTLMRSGCSRPTIFARSSRFGQAP